jgi:serine/threonine protein kinase
MANYERPANQQLKKTNGLRTNYEDEKTNDQYGSKGSLHSTPYQFRLDINIRKTKSKPISKGYGKSVYEVEWIDRDGPPVVLLQIDGTRAKRDASFYVELGCHPHIIRTYGLVHSNLTSTMLLQEHAPQGNLSELLCKDEFRPNENVLWEIFKQICDGMIFLVDRNIIHGDLACRNVLVFQMNPINPTKNLIKLTDFGLTSVSKLYSVVDNSDLTSMTIIPTRYAAPELLQNLKRLDYSEQSDVYSMGVLMWEACACGKLPYSNIDDSEIIRQHKLKDKKLPQPALCSNRLWNIIDECWEFEPKNRPRFQSLKESISRLQSQSDEK